MLRIAPPKADGNMATFAAPTSEAMSSGYLAIAA
jgi:hypothetical protein